MPKPVTLFKKTTGLNNTENPNRLSFDPSTGETELVSAYNVDIGDTGDISRRRGLTATARTENIHSLFCDGGDCFFVLANALYRLNKDYSATGIRNDLSLGMKMSYCQVIEKTYYTNGFQQGCIVDGTSYSWAAGTYVGPTTHRVFSNPPIGNLLTYLSSRIYIAQGMVGWYSEPFAYGQFDLAKNFIPFGQKIRMWKAVAGGIYVGLNDVVIFLAGTDPKDFNFKVVLDSPVVEGTDVYASGDEIGSGEQTEKVVLWTASGGIYVGQADGKVRNVTSGKIVIPESSYGCAVYSDGEYIVLFQ
jgi:hypothetical protein